MPKNFCANCGSELKDGVCPRCGTDTEQVDDDRTILAEPGGHMRPPADDSTELVDRDGPEEDVFATAVDPYEGDKKTSAKGKLPLPKLLIGVGIAVVVLIAVLSLARLLGGGRQQPPAGGSSVSDGDSDTDSQESDSGGEDGDGEDSGDEDGGTADDGSTTTAVAGDTQGDLVLNYSYMELAKGGSIVLSVTNAGDREITWNSTGEKTVSVDADGTVTANAVGTASIVATASDGKTAMCAVTVPGVVEVVPDVTSLVLDVEESHTFEVALTKFGSLEPGVAVSTSDSSVLSVSGMTVTGKKAGSATVTFTADGVSGTCEVVVKAVPVTELSLNLSGATIKAGGSVTLTATVLPEESAATNQVTWGSSDAGVATVSDGVVTGVAPGTAVITAACGGRTVTCDITVE